MPLISLLPPILPLRGSSGLFINLEQNRSLTPFQRGNHYTISGSCSKHSSFGSMYIVLSFFLVYRRGIIHCEPREAISLEGWSDLVGPV